jgi:SAM-dependent methyltransferase
MNERLAPSALAARYAQTIVRNAEGISILDAACGSGRNALALAQLGAKVICADIDVSRIQDLPRDETLQELTPLRIDLFVDPWPFANNFLGGVVNVHFMNPALFPFFTKSIRRNGILLIETVPGCGGNYLQLPNAGHLRDAFERDFDFLFYQERKVGPRNSDAVVVKMVGKRKFDASHG